MPQFVGLLLLEPLLVAIPAALADAEFIRNPRLRVAKRRWLFQAQRKLTALRIRWVIGRARSGDWVFVLEYLPVLAPYAWLQFSGLLPQYKDSSFWTDVKPPVLCGDEID